MTQQNSDAPPPQYQYIPGGKGTLSGWDLSSTNPNTNAEDLAGYSIKQLEEELRDALGNDGVSAKLATLIRLMQNHISDTNNPHRDDAASLAPDIASSYMGTLFRGSLPTALPTAGVVARTHFSCSTAPSAVAYDYTTAGSIDIASSIPYVSGRVPSKGVLGSVLAGDLPVTFTRRGRGGSPVQSLTSNVWSDGGSFGYPTMQASGSYYYGTTQGSTPYHMTRNLQPSSTSYYATLSVYRHLKAMTTSATTPFYLVIDSGVNTTPLVVRYTSSVLASDGASGYEVLSGETSNALPVMIADLNYPVLFRLAPGCSSVTSTFTLTNPLNADGTVSLPTTEDPTNLYAANPNLTNQCSYTVYDTPLEMYATAAVLEALEAGSPGVGAQVGNADIVMDTTSNPQSLWGLSIDVEFPSVLGIGSAPPFMTVFSSNGITIQGYQTVTVGSLPTVNWQVTVSDRIGIVIKTVVTGTSGRLTIATNATQLMIQAGGNDTPTVFSVVARDVDVGSVRFGSAPISDMTPSQTWAFMFVSYILYLGSFTQEQMQFLTGETGG